MRRLIAVVIITVALYMILFVRSETADVVLGDIPLRVRVLRTDARQTAGLSGVASLSAGEGALFVRAVPDRPAFWMKEMRFSIDIIWISPDTTVLGIERDVLPETFPASFSPPASVGWVLEVPAGTASRSGISAGTRVIGLPER